MRCEMKIGQRQLADNEIESCHRHLGRSVKTKEPGLAGPAGTGAGSAERGMDNNRTSFGHKTRVENRHLTRSRGVTDRVTIIDDL